ncbi:MAG: segregation/condensation protein A [Actinobacteria bacterium]|nr:segregation/condensation protein A [Actinomycetota bacterium]
MTYNVKLEVYEGPLDLLLHLIKKEELDIYDIPIARITEQYLSYVRTMQSLDLDVAGEFLVMAATLLQIKARMLVPQPERPPEEEPLPGDGEEEGLDPREELVQRLLEYNRFKGRRTSWAGWRNFSSRGSPGKRLGFPLATTTRWAT